MRLIDALTVKPWLSPGLSEAARAHPDETAAPWDRGVGLTLFLCVVTILFTLVASAYLMRMPSSHGAAMGHGGGGDWQAIGEPPLFWINTFILAASSIAFHAALAAARAGRTAPARSILLGGGLLGILFLVGQFALWSVVNDCRAGGCAALHDPRLAAYPQWAVNPATAFFYLISALHGLHIAGGLAAWALTGRRLFAGGGSVTSARAIQLCARYWDFMLLVWLVMVGLFVST